jgi:O-antigen/teichoic acid export membrane protein
LHLQYGFSNIIVIAIPLVTFFFLCLEQLQNILRSEQRPDLFMRTSMTRLFLEFGTSVLLVVFFSWHWYGRIAGLIISQGTLTVFGVIYFLRRGYLKGTIKREFIKTEMKYALPVIALQMAFFAVNSSDKFYLSHFSNDNNVSLGIYSFASIFASVVFTLHQALIQYFFPKIYSTLAQDTVDYVLIRKNFLIYTAIMAAGTLMLILGAPLAYHLLINKAYLPALDYFYLFCIGYFLWSISYFFFSFLLFHKNKRKILFLSLASIGISLALNYYGISRWASFGGAAAVALSCLIILLLTLLFNIKEVKLVFRSR